MKKFISTGLAALMLASAMASCAPVPTTDSSSASEQGIATHTAYLEEHLDEMPDSLVIATAEDSAAYGVDMTAFADDGYFTRAENGEVIILGKTDAGLERAVRDYVKYGNDDDYFKTYNEGYRVKKLTIAGNDISEYAIIRDDDADECQTFASSELAAYIQKTRGTVLPQFTASEYAAAAEKPARTITLTVDYPALGDEAFTIDIGDDGNLTISGGRFRGCMYGVYDILDDIGWRFMNDSVGKYVEYLYESDHVDLTSALNRTESAAFTYRNIASIGGITGPNTHVKYRTTNSSGAVYGGYGYTGVACHGLQSNHYTIFSGEYQGYYQGQDQTGFQPCFTDEVILEAIDTYVINYVKSRLDAGQEIGKEIMTIDLSQWDTGEEAFCVCESCKKVFNEERCTMGAVLRMGNRAASLLTENGYGGVSVSLLAYNGTNRPPRKTAPLDNVRISYCIYLGSSKTSCSAHPVSGVNCNPDSGYTNVVFAEELNAWSEVCSNNNLDVWYYPFNCYGTAFNSPMFDSIYDSVQYLADGSTSGILYHSFRNTGIILSALIEYVGSKILWNPYISREEFNSYAYEWFMITYGDAGENLYEYFRMCEYASKTMGCWCAFHSANTAKVDNEYMAENFDYMWELFEEAKDMADTSHQETLVERYEAGMLYMCIGITHTDRYINGSEESRAEFAERYTEMHRLFRKYSLMVYDDIMSVEYAPEVLVLEDNPFDTWCTKWSN